MNDDRGIGAMPKLYGAPAYARPPLAPVSPAKRPFDPDDLPLESERDGEHETAGGPADAHGRDAEDSSPAAAADGSPIRLLGRPIRLRLPGRDQAGP